jgi:hypothetical protein
VTATYKDLTNFLVELGIDQIEHTEKTYLGHLIAVYRDLKSWGCDEDLCRGGMFHSIYGTQQFQGFTLPLERRGELREMIGERAERLGYLNCAMYRPVFDETAERGTPPYRFSDRITGEEIELSKEDFDDLCRIHLCDWLEQVPRCGDWGHRREAYRAIAERFGGVALEAYDRVFAAETA